MKKQSQVSCTNDFMRRYKQYYYKKDYKIKVSCWALHWSFHEENLQFTFTAESEFQQLVLRFPRADLASCILSQPHLFLAVF